MENKNLKELFGYEFGTEKEVENAVRYLELLDKLGKEEYIGFIKKFSK